MLRAETLIHETTTTMPQVQPIEGVPTRIDVAFTNKDGVEKNGIRKGAERMLKKVAPALQRLLAQDEFVVYLAGACAPMSFLEQYSFGYFAQFVSRVVLVFTNKRLLVFRVNHNGEWRKSLRGCSLGDAQSAKVTGWLVRYLNVQYVNGKKERYWALRSRDKGKLQVILPKLLEANAGGQTHAQAMQPLCPTCAAALVDGQYECAACGQKFRSEHSLWWRSFIPGASYFYARQTGMGLLHAVIDAFVTIECLLLLLVALSKEQTKTQDFWITFAFFAFLLLLERSIALWHARRFLREFIPIDGTARMQSAAAAR